MKTIDVVLLSLCIISLNNLAHAAPQPPNVLFIAVDDLNDWVGCLGGHPQAKTPNIDRLAAKGVLFEQAYCAAPLCNPSRTAVMTGLNPSTTGIYGNLNWFRDMEQYKDWKTIPQYFKQHGYMTWTGGKIFHMAHGKWSDANGWDHQYSTKTGTASPPPHERYLHGLKDKFPNPIVARLNDWRPIAQKTAETNDWKTSQGAADFLAQDHDKPFFLACGIYRPHLSWYAPQKYFDMHPIDQIRLPPSMADDLNDVPKMGHAMAGETFNTIEKHGEWKNAVQGYLASTSFADACIGNLIDALDKSRYSGNTIVVLWGDHGYHIGEKNHFSKSALWKETTQTPLMIHVPGISESNSRCKRPVGLIDLYPTLIDLCGLPRRNGLDGRSIAPLVKNPQAAWPYPALITHSPHWHGTNHAVHSEQYHYIHYRRGEEELYDNANDPNGYKNLANDPAYDSVKAELKKWLPTTNAPHFRSDLIPGR